MSVGYNDFSFCDHDEVQQDFYNMQDEIKV